MIEGVVLADQVGLSIFGLGEHHGPEFGSTVAAVIFAAAATRTRLIRLSSLSSVRRPGGLNRNDEDDQAAGGLACNRRVNRKKAIRRPFMHLFFGIQHHDNTIRLLPSWAPHTGEPPGHGAADPLARAVRRYTG
ncbi:hypothetical protein LCH33_003875 [Pseudomonas amygdali]|nr:hypothetical protein LCH33_003875 [Pseudomonas amygdali]